MRAAEGAPDAGLVPAGIGRQEDAETLGLGAQVAAEEGAERALAALQPGLHGALAQAQAPGDLGLGPVRDVLRHQNGAGLGRQRGQGAVEEGDELLALQRVLNCRTVRWGQAVPREFVRQCGRGLAGGPAALAARAAQADVAGNRREPGPGAGRVLQALAQAPGLEQRLLREILGGLGPAGQARAQADQPRPVGLAENPGVWRCCVLCYHRRFLPPITTH